MNKWDIRTIEQWAKEFEADEVTVFLAAVAVGLGLALIIAKLIWR